LAGALRGELESGLAGRYAETVLVTLVGRERDALARLDGLAAKAANPVEKAWVRALRLRNTGDWRIARDEKRLTLLETLEEFRALAIGQDDDAALAWLDHRKPKPIPDWGRLALSSDFGSMGTSNRFADVTDDGHGRAAEVLTRLRRARRHVGLFEVVNGNQGSLKNSGGKARIAAIGKPLTQRFQRNSCSTWRWATEAR
jgi:hypothetical protein